MIEALNNPSHTFTREQVAYLLSAALRLGGTDTDLPAPTPSRSEIEEAYERGFNDGLNAYDDRLVSALKHGLCGSDEVTWTQAVDSHHKQVAARQARAEADAAARVPRINDYQGGPVAWEPTANRAAA